MARLFIAPEDLAEVERQARAAFPREACGLLIGTALAAGDIRVSRLAPSRNLAEAPDRFEIDPALYLALQRTLRGSSEAVVGLYHSHPRGAPAPSARDRAEAWIAQFVWLITALDDDGAARHGAFWQDNAGEGANAGFSPLTLVSRAASLA